MITLQGVLNVLKYLQVTYFPLTKQQRSVAEFRSFLRSIGVKRRLSIRTYRLGDKYIG